MKFEKLFLYQFKVRNSGWNRQKKYQAENSFDIMKLFTNFEQNINE